MSFFDWFDGGRMADYKQTKLSYVLCILLILINLASGVLSLLGGHISDGIFFLFIALVFWWINALERALTRANMKPGDEE